MEEGLFLDHVDTDWFLRARVREFSAYGIFSARMTHTLGHGVTRVWFGRWRYLPIYDPQRFYYVSRNSIFLIQQHYSPLIWIILEFVKLAAIMILYGGFLSPGRKHRQMLLAGLIDWFKGKMGCIPDGARGGVI